MLVGTLSPCLIAWRRKGSIPAEITGLDSGTDGTPVFQVRADWIPCGLHTALSKESTEGIHRQSFPSSQNRGPCPDQRSHCPFSWDSAGKSRGTENKFLKVKKEKKGEMEKQRRKTILPHSNMFPNRKQKVTVELERFHYGFLIVFDLEFRALKQNNQLGPNKNKATALPEAGH